jgi:hypothetical protein
VIATDETSEWLVITGPRRLVFPTHTDAAASYFAQVGGQAAAVPSRLTGGARSRFPGDAGQQPVGAGAVVVARTPLPGPHNSRLDEFQAGEQTLDGHP